MLDPRLLQVFVIAAETLNFSTAARKLNLSQPAVTQNIQQLELQVGSPLFVRSARNLSLTTSGLALLPMARQLLTMNSRVESVLDDLAGKVFGDLIIACTTTPGKYVLPILLANFMKLHPRVRAVCNITTRSQAMHQLEAGLVHIAFSSRSDEFDHNVEFLKFLSDPIMLIAHPDHPWAQAGHIDADTLRQGRFVMRDPNSGMFLRIKAGLADFGIGMADLNTVMVVGSTEAVGVAVMQGLGVGFVSGTMHRYISQDKAVVVHVDGLNLSQDIFLCRYKLHAAGNPTNAFWDYARAITEDGKKDLLAQIMTEAV